MSTKQVQGVAQAVVGGIEKPLRPPIVQRLKSERVEEALMAMPGWKALPAGMALHRTRQFFHPGAAANFAAQAGKLAALAQQRVLVQLAGTRVSLTVYCRKDEDGITDTLLGFARQIG
jgi:pterin-4a-carbinolamine dehydratase